MPTPKDAKKAAGAQLGLSGIRVLDLSDSKAALCSRLLADMGADVVRIEPSTGHSTRTLPPFTNEPEAVSESLFFWYYNSNKRSVVLDLDHESGRKDFLGLVRATDILLDGHIPGYLASLKLPPRVLFETNPSLILASVTGFGQWGPYAKWNTSDIVSWAMGGCMSLTGDPDREPLTAPANQADQVVSMWATISILAALLKKRATGIGAHLDLSAQEAVMEISEGAHSWHLYNLDGRSPGGNKLRMGQEFPGPVPYRVYKTADDWAFIGVAQPHQWLGLLKWMGETISVDHFLNDRSLDPMLARMERRQEISALVQEWALGMTSEELFLAGAKIGIPVAPVRRTSEVAVDEQLVSRNFLCEISHPRELDRTMKYLYPSLPFRSASGPLRTHYNPAPVLGAHTQEVLLEWKSRKQSGPKTEDGEVKLPLAGLKVLDFTWFLAGPTMARILADLGATVVKIEARGAGDVGRLATPHAGGTLDMNKGTIFLEANRNKFGMTLDLKSPQAKKVIFGLARWADVALENFTSGTLDRLGFGYEELSSINPKLVMASVSGYGQTGPRRGWPCYHPTSAALSGLTGLFAYPENGIPLGFSNYYLDWMAGFFGTIGVLEALLRTGISGVGDHIDTSQFEVGVTLMGPELLRWTVNRQESLPMGNKSGSFDAALQGCYQCIGDDSWIVVTAASELLAGIATIVGVAPNSDAAEIEAHLSLWAMTQTPWAAVKALQEAGVAAGVVCNGASLLDENEQVIERGMVVTIEHAAIGKASLLRSPVLWDNKPLPITKPSPLIGEHTEYILREILGFTAVDYEAFVTAGVV